MDLPLIPEPKATIISFEFAISYANRNRKDRLLLYYKHEDNNRCRSRRSFWNCQVHICAMNLQAITVDSSAFKYYFYSICARELYALYPNIYLIEGSKGRENNVSKKTAGSDTKVIFVPSDQHLNAWMRTIPTGLAQRMADAVSPDGLLGNNKRTNSCRCCCSSIKAVRKGMKHVWR